MSHQIIISFDSCIFLVQRMIWLYCDGFKNYETGQIFLCMKKWYGKKIENEKFRHILWIIWFNQVLLSFDDFWQ